MLWHDTLWGCMLIGTIQPGSLVTNSTFLHSTFLDGLLMQADLFFIFFLAAAGFFISFFSSIAYAAGATFPPVLGMFGNGNPFLAACLARAGTFSFFFCFSPMVFTIFFLSPELQDLEISAT